MPPLCLRSLLTALVAALFAVFSFASADDKEAKEAPSGDSQYDVPEGTPEELLGFIKKQQASQPSGTSRKARMDHLRNACQAIVTAAERIGDAKVDDETIVAARKAEFEALTMLKRLGDDDASEKLETLSEKLKSDKRPAIANLIKLQSLTQKMEKLDASNSKAVEEFVNEVKQYLTTPDIDPQAGRLIQSAIVLLYRSGEPEQAAQLGRDVVSKLAKSDKPELVMVAAQLAGMTGQIFEAQGQEKQAAKFYREISDLLAKSDNPASRQAADQLEGSARKLELVGQPMPISGKLVEGGTFDISQFKGKVVLVDFWATWCGPCVAELPNVKEVYEKYHERGFEVVGISLDNEVDPLTKFIEEKHIPWPILFEGGEGTSGWAHPLAKKYGVNAIPMAVLIDRAGKVVTLSARGGRLGELVAELIDSKPGAGDGTEAAGKKAG
jgi:thiol-disulfide isomerase/thioredoxin